VLVASVVAMAAAAAAAIAAKVSTKSGGINLYAGSGATAARAEDGSAAAGQDRAMAMIANAGSQVLLGPTVSASRGSDSVDVEVRGHAVSVVPGLSLPVRATAAGPVERFEPDPGP